MTTQQDGERREAMTKAARELVGDVVGAHPWHIIDRTIDAIIALDPTFPSDEDAREAAQAIMDKSSYRIWPADAKANIAEGLLAFAAFSGSGVARKEGAGDPPWARVDAMYKRWLGVRNEKGELASFAAGYAQGMFDQVMMAVDDPAVDHVADAQTPDPISPPSNKGGRK